CLLEPQTPPAAPVGQSDPKEDGALRQSRRDHRELPEFAAYLCVQPPGTWRRGRRDPRLPGAEPDRLERAVCQTLESEDQTGVYAHDAENFEAGAGLRVGIIAMEKLYTTKFIFVVKYRYRPLYGGTTDDRQAAPPQRRSARPSAVS